MPLWSKILVSIVAVELLGGVGAFLTSSQIPGWYAGLEKPVGTPPNWLFGPVWTVLYAMMGLAFALVWHSPDAGAGRRRALACFAIQMLLNVSWTPVFFGLHQMLAALGIIVALWLAIVCTIAAFRQVWRPAAVLLVPYLAWVSYATYLNAGYWWLNR